MNNLKSELRNISAGTIMNVQRKNWLDESGWFSNSIQPIS